MLALAATACSTAPRVVLSWDPVTTNQEGTPVGPVAYDVYVRVNDGPEQRFGPVSEPQLELPLRLGYCDRLRAQVVAIHRGLRSPRSEVLERHITPPPGQPDCSTPETRSDRQGLPA